MIALGLSALLGVGELTARATVAFPSLPAVAERTSPFGMFRADPETGVALAKHAWIPAERFATNTFGHRDRPREAGEPAPWVTRVAVIGGTTAAGRGVADEHTFARLLEDSFPAAVAAPEDGAPEDGAPEDGAPEDGASPRGLEVWNLAVPGFGAEQAVERLDADWETVNPDVVLFAVDLAETPMRTLFGPGSRRVVDGELVTGPWAPFAGSPYDDERASVLAPTRWALVEALRRHLELQERPGVDAKDVLAPFDGRVFGGWAWLWQTPAPFAVDVAWDVVGDALDRLASTCRERGAELVILAVPGRIDVDPAAFEAAREAGFEPLRDTEAVRTIEAGVPGARLQELATARGLDVLDPTEALQAAGGPTHYEDLPTWNVRGHRAAAAYLGEALAATGTIPPHDRDALRAALTAAAPEGATETRFDGGFRPSRDLAARVVRWETAATFAW